MTIEEFLVELRKTANKVTWDNLEGKYLRATIDGRRYCPLTFVCQTRLGRQVSEFEAEKAGIRLGLSRQDRWNIMLASDWGEYDMSKLQTQARFDIELRNNLEEILL